MDAYEIVGQRIVTDDLDVGQLATLCRGVKSSHAWPIESWRADEHPNIVTPRPVDVVLKGETVLLLEIDNAICRVLTTRGKIGWIAKSMLVGVL